MDDPCSAMTWRSSASCDSTAIRRDRPAKTIRVFPEADRDASFTHSMTVCSGWTDDWVLNRIRVSAEATLGLWVLDDWVKRFQIMLSAVSDSMRVCVFKYPYMVSAAAKVFYPPGQKEG